MTTTSATLPNLFVEQAIYRMEENVPRITRCLLELSEMEIWERPNPASNCPGNLILHLCGNITQYIISGLGQREDTRNRDAEFTASYECNREELIARLQATTQEAVSVIRGLSAEELTLPRQIQGFNTTAVGAIMHVVEHYSYHTGQIAFWTKFLKSVDLGFYAGLNLNMKNKF
ncbi:MAG: DUF1572 domain-containing protein [Chitinophagia bacterium]|nr:DUF1572 domain-containing protein [Chitinophagia bacterium]